MRFIDVLVLDSHGEVGSQNDLSKVSTETCHMDAEIIINELIKDMR